jgi:hypothetical protein
MLNERAFTLRKDGYRDLTPAVSFLSTLPRDKEFRVVVKEVKPRRTLSQNALLWALYDDLLNDEQFGGWTRDEVHEEMLKRHFGTEERMVWGMIREFPRRRSSGLSKQEFSELVEAVIRFAAENGIPLRNDPQP